MNDLLVCIYEDQSWESFEPLSQLRAVWDLRCGALTLGQRLQKQLQTCKTVFHVRRPLMQMFNEDTSWSGIVNPGTTRGPALFVNCRALLDRSAAARLLDDSGDVIYHNAEGEVAAFRIMGRIPGQVKLENGEPLEPRQIIGLEPRRLDVRLVSHLWELLRLNHPMMLLDFESAAAEAGWEDLIFPDDTIARSRGNVKASGEVRFGPGVIIDAEENGVYFENGVHLGAGVILCAGGGPIWLSSGVIVEAGAIINGPAFVGAGSVIRSGARISDGCSFGPQCRVGGEVTASIIHSYSNKQHSGYLGNSYLGSWVNLGAATDNSDLKNNYRPIKVSLKGREIDTGDLHVGAFIGDFTRTAIHTRLGSGSTIGVCSHILDSDFPAVELPPFTWAGNKGYSEYRWDKALETISTIMPRRGRSLTPGLEFALRDLFQQSSGFRRTFLESHSGA